jgi:hypothetical protein
MDDFKREKNNIICYFKLSLSWAPWLMPVILATQEAEIRRIVV